MHFWLVIYNNLGLIMQAIVTIGGLLMASGLLRNRYIRLIIQDGVAVAMQYEKTQTALGNPPAKEVLKLMAIQYVQARAPYIDVMALGQDIEAAVAAWNAQRQQTAPKTPNSAN